MTASLGPISSFAGGKVIKKVRWIRVSIYYIVSQKCGCAYTAYCHIVSRPAQYYWTKLCNVFHRPSV